MKSTQKLIFEFMDKYAAEIKREISVSNNWENTGIFYMYKGDDVYKVAFNFQTDSCTLDFADVKNYYIYDRDMKRLKLHLKSFIRFGDSTTLR